MVVLPLWMRLAIVKTLTGTILGLVTSIALVLLSVYGGLADFDYDVGLRMHRFGQERLKHRSSSLSPEKTHGDTYVFLDVDPEPDRRATVSHESTWTPAAMLGSIAACKALVNAFPEHYALSTGQLPPSVNNQSASVLTGLECSPTRPLNRYLLAALVRELRERGARLIVVDVELAAEVGVIPAAENQALVKALIEQSLVPVIFVKPVAFAWQLEPSKINYVHIDQADPFEQALEKTFQNRQSELPGVRVAAAVVLPEPGQPLRRYPKCYKTDAAGVGPLPSLPFLAAMLSASSVTDPSTLCAQEATREAQYSGNAYVAPRIVYTLPSLRGHQDDPGEGEGFRLWSIYRRVYNRCLASNFWVAESICGQKVSYEDKVVVIGASNRLRRDRHYTPIGNMAGAEVVINTIRSFVLYADHKDKEIGEAMWKKAQIVLMCGPVWFIFFGLQCFLQRCDNTKQHLSNRQKASRVMMVFLVFLVVLLAVIGITVSVTYSSFSIVVGVLAVALEQYVEVVTKWVVHPCDAAFRKLLGLSAPFRQH